jgi:hypothetical protein
MKQVARHVHARSATVLHTRRARVGAATGRANLARRAVIRARAAVCGVAPRIDARTVTCDIGRVAVNLAAAAFAGRSSAQGGLASLAASSAVQRIARRIHTARAAGDPIAPARKGAGRLEADWRAVGRRRTGFFAAAAMLRIAIQPHAVLAAHGFAVAATCRRGTIISSISDTNVGAVAVVAGHAPTLVLAT